MEAHPQHFKFTLMINYNPVRLVLISLSKEPGSSPPPALKVFFIFKHSTVIIDHRNNSSSGGLPELTLSLARFASFL